MIHRKTKNNKIQIDIDLINNNILSYGAKGLLVFLLSKNDNYEYTMAEIIDSSKDTGTIAKKYIKELESKNYLKRECIKENGRFKWIWNVYEEPNI
jgi:DNA-binding MarR family transcriptional regulator